MSTRPQPAPGATRRRQRGAAVLLMMITLIVILIIVMAPRLTLWQARNAASDRGYQTLMQAKTAILAHAANPGADAVPGRRLGQISLTPDLPVTAGKTLSRLRKAGRATPPRGARQAPSRPQTPSTSPPTPPATFFRPLPPLSP